MNVTIVSFGRWKDGALRDAFQDYATRCRPALALVELELSAREAHGDIKTKEAALLDKHWPVKGAVIACDENAKQFTSRGLATALADLQTTHGPNLTFIIGGADGLAPSVVQRAQLRLSLGQLTWPHLLVRVLLAEQIYRAQTILAGHPYHRD